MSYENKFYSTIFAEIYVTFRRTNFRKTSVWLSRRWTYWLTWCQGLACNFSLNSTSSQALCCKFTETLNKTLLQWITEHLLLKVICLKSGIRRKWNWLKNKKWTIKRLIGFIFDSICISMYNMAKTNQKKFWTTYHSSVTIFSYLCEISDQGMNW